MTTEAAPQASTSVEDEYSFLFDDLPQPAATQDTSAPAAAAPSQAPAPSAESSMLQAMQAQMQAQSQQMEMLRHQLAAAAQYAPPVQHEPRRIELPAVTLDDLGLSAEERTLYSEMGPLVRAIGGAIGKQYSAHLTPLLGELDQLRADTAAVTERTQAHVRQASVQGFNATLYAALPGLETTVATPAWRTYLNEAAPLTGGRTFAQLIQDAHARQDLGVLRDVYNTFQSRQASAVSAPAAVPSLGSANLGTANAVAFGMQQQAQAQGGMQAISEAKMDELTDRYRRGLISHAAYQKAQDALLDAALGGAVLR